MDVAPDVVRIGKILRIKVLEKLCYRKYCPGIQPLGEVIPAGMIK